MSLNIDDGRFKMEGKLFFFYSLLLVSLLLR